MDRVGATPRSAVDRTACIDIRALPLQLLLRRHPEWRQRPVAVVEQEKPQSPLLWVNAPAGQAGIRSGMRYASALSLDRDLCAGTVSEREIREAVRQVHQLLDRFSPRVEPCEKEPGVFWADAGGLGKLYGSLETWARQIDFQLSRLEFPASIVIGFSRFGSYALAKAERLLTVLPSLEVEQTQIRRVSLLRLQLDPGLRDRLEKLAIHTLEDLLGLPEAGIQSHLGEQAWNLYRLASGELPLPLQPRSLPEPLRACMDLNEPDPNAQRLLFRIKQLLDPLLRAAAERYQAAAALRLQLRLENGTRHRHRIQPARPTLEVSVLLDLVRLRLERVCLRAPLLELSLEVEAVRVSAKARNLLQRTPRRNNEAALRALARVRAEFGPDSVLSARLRPGHLPEARWEWRPFRKLPPAVLRPVPIRPLVRRTHVRPKPLDWKKPPDRRPLLGYLISGGWWNREIRRDYRFVNSKRGEILWAYYDPRERRWYSQGRVE